MLSLLCVGQMIAVRRRSLALSQSALAKYAKIGLSTLDALENGRMGELGFSKVVRVLSVLGLELRIEKGAARPTLEELIREQRDDQNLDRPR